MVVSLQLSSSSANTVAFLTGVAYGRMVNRLPMVEEIRADIVVRIVK